MDSSSVARSRREDRATVIGSGVTWFSRWGLRVLISAATLWLIGWVVGRLWVVVMPVVVGLLITTILWPLMAWLLRHKWKPALAATAVLLLGLLVVAATIALIVPSVVSQAPEIGEQAAAGLVRIQEWMTGPPLNLEPEQISGAVAGLGEWLQTSAATIATGVLAGLGTATSVLVTFATALILVFFFLKDGPKFTPWVERTAGARVGGHINAVLDRSWSVLGSFIRTQAIVSLVDAVLIGVGLVILGVPLALALAVITFFGGFIPIVGAFVAGGVAVLVALVANGPTIALLTLALIVLVQQIESNVLQPIMQSRSLNLHAAVVLLAVTGGASLYGITGAFLAVPVVAVVAAIWRYIDERIAAATATSTTDQAELPA
jgi:putative heme transporter